MVLNYVQRRMCQIVMSFLCHSSSSKIITCLLTINDSLYSSQLYCLLHPFSCFKNTFPFHQYNSTNSLYIQLACYCIYVSYNLLSTSPWYPHVYIVLCFISRLPLKAAGWQSKAQYNNANELFGERTLNFVFIHYLYSGPACSFFHTSFHTSFSENEANRYYKYTC